MDTTGKIKRFMLLDALQIKIMWLTMFNSSTPTTLIAEINKNNAEMQIAIDQNATIEIPSSGESKEIKIDGTIQPEGALWKSIPDTGEIKISLPAGTHTISVTFHHEQQDSFQINPEN